jgi:hypothetical protein
MSSKMSSKMSDEVEGHQTGYKGRQALVLSILSILLLRTHIRALPLRTHKRAGGGGRLALDLSSC